MTVHEFYQDDEHATRNGARRTGRGESCPWPTVESRLLSLDPLTRQAVFRRALRDHEVVRTDYRGRRAPVGELATLLTHVSYIAPKGTMRLGWAWQEMAVIGAWTGLSDHEIRRGRELGKRTRFLDQDYDRLRHRLYYRVRHDAPDLILVVLPHLVVAEGMVKGLGNPEIHAASISGDASSADLGKYTQRGSREGGQRGSRQKHAAPESVTSGSSSGTTSDIPSDHQDARSRAEDDGRDEYHRGNKDEKWRAVEDALSRLDSTPASDAALMWASKRSERLGLDERDLARVAHLVGPGRWDALEHRMRHVERSMPNRVRRGSSRARWRYAASAVADDPHLRSALDGRDRGGVVEPGRNGYVSSQFGPEQSQESAPHPDAEMPEPSPDGEQLIAEITDTVAQRNLAVRRWTRSLVAVERAGRLMLVCRQPGTARRIRDLCQPELAEWGAEVVHLEEYERRYGHGEHATAGGTEGEA